MVLSIEWHARSTNTSAGYYGSSGISASNGRELLAGAIMIYDFKEMDPGSPGVPLNTFYVVATGTAMIDWTVILV